MNKSRQRPSRDTAQARNASRLIACLDMRERQAVTKVSTRPEVGEDADIDRVAGIVDDYRNFHDPSDIRQPNWLNSPEDPAVAEVS